MKKVLMLGAVAAAAYGAFKFFGKKDEQDETIYGASSYAPQPDSQQPPPGEPQPQF